jgi:hypothetical protein
MDPQEPRTLSLFCEILDNDYAWRIKELSNYRNAIPREKSIAQNSLLRAGITLLYAHWEGLVRNAANQYYKFLSYQNHNTGDFQSPLIALLISGEANQLIESKKLAKKVFVFDKILKELDAPAQFTNSPPIRTSNLNFDIFVDVCSLLCIDSKEFETKNEFIDKILIDRRNTIAHGKYLDLNYEDFNEVYRSVINLLRRFKDLVSNSAALKKYLR